MRRISVVLGILSGLGSLMACGPTVTVPTEQESTTSGQSTGLGGSSAGAGTTTAATTTTGGTTAALDEGSGSETWGGFIPPADVMSYYECNIFTQDCPLGEKCMPFSNDGGGAWNDRACFPLAEDPAAPGEPCTVEDSPQSGVDTCERGAMCWDVNQETLEGVCIPLCSGSDQEPSCEDPERICAIASDGALALCIGICHPLQGDCPMGEGCYAFNDSFHCVPDDSENGGAPGDPCEYVNVCEPGNLCLDPTGVPDCGGGLGCCSAICDLGDEEPPCLPEQVCLPWYEPGSAPPGYDDVGVCVLP